MKIRTDFVTNSSSSSFIVAVKDVTQALETIENLPSWVKPVVKNYFSFMSRKFDAPALSTAKDVKNWFKNQWGEDDWAPSGLKEKCLTAVKNGYTVFDVVVDYSDEAGNEFFSNLPSKDDGEGFYLVDSGV